MLVNWEIPDKGELTLVAPSNILFKNVFLPETQTNEPTENPSKGSIAQPDNKMENAEPQIGEPVMMAIALPPDQVYKKQPDVTQIKTYVELQNQLIEQQ